MSEPITPDDPRDDIAAADGAVQGLYGAPQPGIVDVAAGAVQLSPLLPGSRALEEMAEATLGGLVMLAPPGTLERRYAMAHALRVLRPMARLTVLAPKDKGGSRIARELESFGAEVSESARRHHRIATARRPQRVTGLDEAIAAGAPRVVEATGLWSQPGVFSWDRTDPGSALLAAHLPAFAGRGADLGCGIGNLALRLLAASPEVSMLTLVDCDRRAVDCARRNVADARARFAWADVRALAVDRQGLDFVVMNPPFHDGGAEDRELGLGFIRRAAELLRRGGRCWLVANRHLPYEAAMQPLFATLRNVVEQGGYKVYEAVK